MKDHAILRRGLDILEGMVQKLEGGDRIDIADVAAILKVFRSCEHIDEQVLVAAVESALGARQGVDFVRASRQLAVVLRNHLEMESVKQGNSPEAEDVLSDTSPERPVNLTRLEHIYAVKTSRAARSRAASATYGARTY